MTQHVKRSKGSSPEVSRVVPLSAMAVLLMLLVGMRHIAHRPLSASALTLYRGSAAPFARACARAKESRRLDACQCCAAAPLSRGAWGQAESGTRLVFETATA